MKKQVSSIASSILALLNNIDELIVKSNNRQDAKEVMRAMTIYAASKNYSLPNEKIENFYAILLDGRPMTLSFIIKDIARDIVMSERKK